MINLVLLRCYLNSLGFGSSSCFQSLQYRHLILLDCFVRRIEIGLLLGKRYFHPRYHFRPELKRCYLNSLGFGSSSCFQSLQYRHLILLDCFVRRIEIGLLLGKQSFRCNLHHNVLSNFYHMLLHGLHNNLYHPCNRLCLPHSVQIHLESCLKQGPRSSLSQI